MTDNFEKKVAVDGSVVNEGEFGSSTFSPGEALPAARWDFQRWTAARKREVVLRLLRDEPVELLSRQWRRSSGSSSGVRGGIDASLKNARAIRSAELDSAMKRSGS